MVEQQRPGEEARKEDEAAGLPDAWIFNDKGWSILIESKISANLAVGQLRRHLATAERRGFPDATLLVLTARREALELKGNVIALPWVEVYGWLLREKRWSEWAGRCASYMEILESQLIEEGKLKEGGVTTFSGIPFDSENPYSYLEAKRLLKLAMDSLRKNTRLRRELHMDPAAPGRGAITGREGVAVWDFLRFRRARSAQSFTQFPHLTLAIEHNRLLVIVTVPNGVRADYRRRLLDLGPNGFSALLADINGRLLKALRGDKGASPRLIVVQRRYLTQRSPAIYDATIEFDLRTAFQKVQRHGKRYVKHQPQWLSATFSALTRKKSNLQIGIGASFLFATSSSVRDKGILGRIAATWLSCKPLLTAMGLR